MKVLICGGRSFYNERLFNETMDKLIAATTPFTCIVHGGAPGADSLADRYARRHSIDVKVYKADWTSYGRFAGPMRNEKMLDDNPDIELVIAFPGGFGTADMVKKAKKRKIIVLEI